MSQNSWSSRTILILVFSYPVTSISQFWDNLFKATFTGAKELVPDFFSLNALGRNPIQSFLFNSNLHRKIPKRGRKRKFYRPLWFGKKGAYFSRNLDIRNYLTWVCYERLNRQILDQLIFSSKISHSTIERFIPKETSNNFDVKNSQPW